MTDKRRALHIGEDQPLADIPTPRVIRISDHRARSRPSRPDPSGGADTAPPARLAQSRRGFLRRVVGYLAADAGIRQFIDLGSRLPAGEGIAQTARAHDPDARVVYVDTDTAVSLHGTTPPAGSAAVPTVAVESMRPELIVTRLRARGLIDFGAPVAVLLTDTAPLALGHGGDPHLPHDLVRALHAVLCPGSHVAIAQRVSPDRSGTAPAPDAHSRELAAAVFEPFTVIEPGLADLAWWPYPDEEVTAEGTGVLAGVGRRD
ncbi:SAM-dependent methyltransferase [Nocardiopsis mangrovi]|uniref:SAM-dependent methyltransferase n=1 Tax=Nocardiopsis mangrovi TaxID=1179818 RepID=A0ABV9DTI1_9ACTN